jgi:hypothetical protein
MKGGFTFVVEKNVQCGVNKQPGSCVASVLVNLTRLTRRPPRFHPRLKYDATSMFGSRKKKVGSKSELSLGKIAMRAWLEESDRGLYRIESHFGALQAQKLQDIGIVHIPAPLTKYI